MKLDCTIVIPVKNGAAFLPSLFEQLIELPNPYPQIIIVEDNSSDDSFLKIRSFAAENHHVVLLKNSGNGLVDALNTGFARADTTWVARMDVDDLYDRNRLEFQLKFATPADSVIFSDYRIFRDQPKRMNLIPNAVNSNAVLLSLLKNHRAPHPVALINLDKYRAVGGYHNSARFVEDLDLWFRLSTIGTLRGVPTALLDYRRHSGSVTAAKRQFVLAAHAECVQKNRNVSILKRAIAELDLKSVLDEYKLFSYRSLRSFLLILDIYSVEKFLKKNSYKLILISFLRNLILNPTSLVGFLQALLLKFRLRMYRS